MDSSSSSTTSKESRLLALKKKLVKLYGTDIIKLKSLETGFEVIYVDDSAEEKQRKKDHNASILEEINEDYRVNEALVILELTKLAAKVRETSIEVGGVDKKYGYGTRTEREFKFKCVSCGNEVSKSLRCTFVISS